MAPKVIKIVNKSRRTRQGLYLPSIFQLSNFLLENFSLFERKRKCRVKFVDVNSLGFVLS